MEEDSMKKTVRVFLAFFIFLSLAFGSSTLSAAQEPKIEIKTIQPFSYCCIHHIGPFTEIQSVIAQLYASIQGQNILPGGTMIGIYYNSPADTDPQDLEWDIGFPCDAHVSPLQPLERKIWAATQVAATIHSGSFESTGETYLVIFEWLAANGMVPDGPVLEMYLTMPAPDTKPEDMRTEIWVPFKLK